MPPPNCALYQKYRAFFCRCNALRKMFFAVAVLLPFAVIYLICRNAYFCRHAELVSASAVLCC